LGASFVAVVCNSAEEKPATVAEILPRMVKVEKERLVLPRSEQCQLASGPSATLVSGCRLSVLFHASVLNVEHRLGAQAILTRRTTKENIDLAGGHLPGSNIGALSQSHS
jgi:hypothetical protein